MSTLVIHVPDFSSSLLYRSRSWTSLSHSIEPQARSFGAVFPLRKFTPSKFLFSWARNCTSMQTHNYNVLSVERAMRYNMWY